MLFGRGDDCASLNNLLTSVQRGQSEALVVFGPAGIGKTALLDYAADGARGMQVLRARGAPAETGIPYSGLSQILTPLVDLLPSLPAPQAAAVAAALAIGPSNGNDAFPVYLGTLNLLAAAASNAPVVVLIDDGHWLDTPTLDAVLFAHRRLSHDPVLLLLAFRQDPTLAQPPPGIPVLELNGLDQASAAALLGERGYAVDNDLLIWLVRATGGNPLALRDLLTYAAPADFASYALRSRPAPIGPTLLAAYGQTTSAMPTEAQQALLIATMLDDAELRVVTRALGFAGLAVQALEPAEDAGLLDIADGVLKVRHPLVRSAVSQVAAPSARRAAHLAAADGLQSSNRPHRAEARIWHLAEAAVGVDESTAALLEELGNAAKARGGYASACSTYEKAAELGEAGQVRVGRLAAAAEAAYTAGLSTRCVHLLDIADDEVGTSAQAGLAIEHLRGRVDTWSGNPSVAARRLQLLAERTRSTNPLLSCQAAADAVVAAVLSGQMDLAATAAQLASSIGQGLGPAAAPFGDVLVGGVQAMRGDGISARHLLDRCRPAFDIEEPPVELLQPLVYLATGYTFIDCLQEAIALFERAITMARRYGAVGLLPFALTHAAVAQFRRGAWDAAYAGASEALILSEDTGRTTDRPNTLAVLAMIDAARGRELAREHALAAIREASAMGSLTVVAQGNSMLGLFELGIGRPAAAVEPLQRCGALAVKLGVLELGHLQWAAELVEALVRSGATSETGSTLRTMRDVTHSGSTTLNRAILARCEGIVATDGSWEEHFSRALSLHHDAETRPFELARTELCLGERLRRQRRRRDARTHLAAAWESFSGLGAVTWAQRASHELEATGTTMPGPMVHVSDLLTPQELQVAIAVAAGGTNREIAGSLFLSQKTVEFHLSGIYRRLGLHSRTDLKALLKDRQRSPGLN